MELELVGYMKEVGSPIRMRIYFPNVDIGGEILEKIFKVDTVWFPFTQITWNENETN